MDEEQRRRTGKGRDQKSKRLRGRKEFKREKQGIAEEGGTKRGVVTSRKEKKSEKRRRTAMGTQ